MTPNLRELAVMGFLVLLLFAAFQRHLFNPIWPNHRTLVAAVVLILLLLAALPIWHWHGDFVGRMHGHAIWDGGHVH